MAAIDLIVEENVTATRSLATDRYFLNSFHKAGRQRAGVLRLYRSPGDVISAGRFQRIGHSSRPIWRRLSGGRAVPFGGGFLGLSLLLPHRSALVAEEPLALSPVQVPNRYVRGLLAGLRALGVDAVYPGRDFVTVERKLLGLVSFEVDERGALVFDAILAVGRDFSVLGRTLDASEPQQRLWQEEFATNSATCLARECSQPLTTRRLAEAIAEGYAKEFRLEIQRRDLTQLEDRAVAAVETREFGAGWIAARTPRSDLPYSAVSSVPLGRFEVHLALEQDRFVREVQLSGDFIANSSAVELLERELKLCPADWRPIAMITDEVFQRPANFILGIGKLRTIPDTIVKALPG